MNYYVYIKVKSRSRKVDIAKNIEALENHLGHAWKPRRRRVLHFSMEFLD